MSDTKYAYLGCDRPSRFWRLCDEHGPEYADVAERIVRASTPKQDTPWRFVSRGTLEANGAVPSRLDYSLTRVTKPTPPTLREWLGDRVSELGRWADVLREQPVPAGWIEKWEWKLSNGRWMLYTWARNASLWQSCEPFRIVRAVTSDDGWLECLQMALFTRHPDVKPEPKRAAFPVESVPGCGVMDVIGPIREETISADRWSLKAAIDLAARQAYQWWWGGNDLRLELNIGHAPELEAIIRARESGYTISGHGPMTMMTMSGPAGIMWTWPDVGSVSMLDVRHDGRRIIVRKEKP